jgi:hypothetical protein
MDLCFGVGKILNLANLNEILDSFANKRSLKRIKYTVNICGSKILKF